MAAKGYNKYFCCCILCGSKVSTNNLNKHYNSNLCQKGGTFHTVYPGLEQCPYCKVPKNQIQNQFQNHVRWCDENPKKEKYLKEASERFENGNPYLTEESKKKISKSIKNLHDNGHYKHAYEKIKQNPPFLGKFHNEETKEKISIAARNSNHQRICKSTHEYVDKKGRIFQFDSSWEDLLADRLDELDIHWERPDPIKYISHGKEKKYFPDFYLPDYNLYLDPKNPYVENQQKEKLEIVYNIINLEILRSEEECKNWSLENK